MIGKLLSAKRLSRRAWLHGAVVFSAFAVVGCGSDSFEGEPVDLGYNLDFLTISVGTLTPAFVSSKVSYTASVANSVVSMTMTPRAATAGATIKINGVLASSGSASSAIALAVGANTIRIVVTAPDTGNEKTYTVVVTRASS